MLSSNPGSLLQEQTPKTIQQLQAKGDREEIVGDCRETSREIAEDLRAFASWLLDVLSSGAEIAEAILRAPVESFEEKKSEDRGDSEADRMGRMLAGRRVRY